MPKVTVAGGESYEPGREPPGWQPREPEEPDIPVADSDAPVADADAEASEELPAPPPRRIPPTRTMPPGDT